MKIIESLEKDHIITTFFGDVEWYYNAESKMFTCFHSATKFTKHEAERIADEINEGNEIKAIVRSV